MKKIGLIITNLAGSGAEKIVIQMARMFKSKGIDVHIFLLENVLTYDNINDLQIHLLSQKRDIYKVLKIFGDKLLANKLNKMVERIESDGTRFDLFLSNSPSADRVMFESKQANIRYVIHNSYAFEIKEFREMGKVSRANKKLKLYRRIYKGGNLITVSERAKNNFKLLDIDYKSCQTIYNPFNFEEIRQLGSKKLDLPEESYLLSASAFRFVKRHDILLETYAKLKNPPPLKLLCPLNPELLKLIKKFDLEKKVEILGFKTNPYPYIKNAKMLILSSQREGLPTVLIEALILGTPVVSTDCVSGPSEILTGKLSKYLAKVNDSDDLSMKIQLALKQYPEIEDKYLDKFNQDIIYKYYEKNAIEGLFNG
ncbi:MAG: hypothetical protein DRQ78_13560 [Epsilonproteobacteria bacterium]|nr:MAG: hypothetical protein DRQ78_13560 [Campylobacterota bacterium]